MQREFFICSFQSSFLRLNDASMFQNFSCQISKPSDVSGGIFSKRVTDDDDRRKTFFEFLASRGEDSSLTHRVVTMVMEYRSGVPTRDRDKRRPHRLREHCKNFSCPSRSSVLLLSFELLCLTMSPSTLIFLLK